MPAVLIWAYWSVWDVFCLLLRVYEHVTDPFLNPNVKASCCVPPRLPHGLSTKPVPILPSIFSASSCSFPCVPTPWVKQPLGGPSGTTHKPLQVVSVEATLPSHLRSDFIHSYSSDIEEFIKKSSRRKAGRVTGLLGQAQTLHLEDTQ